MSTVYTGNAANIDPNAAPATQQPADTDPRNAESVDVALRKLTDLAAFLLNSMWAAWANIVALICGNWTARTLPSGVFYAVANNGIIWAAVGTNVVATSLDFGATWTAGTIPAGTYKSILWTGLNFVAIGNNICATSPDGFTWTSRTIPAGAYRALAYNSIRLVAVGGTSCATSTDLGATWTAQTFPSDFSALAVCWAGTPTLGTGNFVAVGQTAGAAGSTYAISPTGVAWSESSALHSVDYTSIAYNGTAVVAMGTHLSDSTKFLARSTDLGVTWSAIALPIFPPEFGLSVWTLNGVQTFVATGYAAGPSSGWALCATSKDGALWGLHPVAAVGPVGVSPTNLFVLSYGGNAGCSSINFG